MPRILPLTYAITLWTQGNTFTAWLPGAHDHWLMNAVSGVQNAIGAPATTKAHHLVIKTTSGHMEDLISTETLNLLHARKTRFIFMVFHRDPPQSISQKPLPSKEYP
jgi:hypothetical protein